MSGFYRKQKNPLVFVQTKTIIQLLLNRSFVIMQTISLSHAFCPFNPFEKIQHIISINCS